ncbi:hypothetical protein [Kribbella sp. NPDC049227]|uniref:hypothetical protein n=1 Tax=Kribbella sp. NPDC049227 TaxID=3364113 RepID=UPI003719A29A
MLLAAVELEKSQAQAEANVRSAADKWIAGVTAIFSLFGLASLVTGKDALAGVPNWAKITIGVLLLIAIICAAIALVSTFRAAYGWPHSVNVSTDRRLRDWFVKRLRTAADAADNLRLGVLLALTSLLAVVAAVAVLWFAPTKPPTPMLKITSTNETVMCGEILNTKNTGKLRIRYTDGSVHEVAVTEVSKAENVKTCPG